MRKTKGCEIPGLERKDHCDGDYFAELTPAQRHKAEVVS